MSGERIGSEPTSESWQTPQIEAAPSFGPPQSHSEKSGEKKSRRRNKKKNRGQNAGAQADGADGRRTPDRPEPPRPKPHVELNMPSSLFEEKTAGDKPTAPKIIGEKAFAAVELGESTIWERDKDSEAAPAMTKDRTAETVRPAQVTEVTIAHDAKVEPANDDKGEEKPPAPSRLVRGEERRFSAQPMQQHQAAERQPAGSSPEPEGPPAAEPVLPYEQLHDMPEPPPLPPDPMAFAASHRRRFWNEEPAETYDERLSDHEVVPPVYDYERPADAGNDPAEAPIGTMAAGMAASRNVYESDIPPGLQRSASEARRNALLAFGAGWVFGRRGKNKAIRQERQAVARTLAEADDAVKHAELSAMTAEKRASSRFPAPRHVGNSPLADAKPAAIARRTAEVITVPLAAAASVAAFEKARPRRESEAASIPRAAKAAAARAAERVIVTAQEAPAPVPAARLERPVGKRELLKAAKDVKIDGVSIKEVYKAKRIDEDGMRAVVETYLKGGDVRQRLAREVAIKEQSYEVDPRIRSHYRAGERSKERSGQGAGRERLARVGNQAGLVLGHAKEFAVEGGGKVAAVSSKAAQSATKAVAKGAKTAQHDLIDNSHTNDWLSITAVVIVYAIILFMLFG